MVWMKYNHQSTLSWRNTMGGNIIEGSWSRAGSGSTSGWRDKSSVAQWSVLWRNCSVSFVQSSQGILLQAVQTAILDGGVVQVVSTKTCPQKQCGPDDHCEEVCKGEVFQPRKLVFVDDHTPPPNQSDPSCQKKHWNGRDEERRKGGFLQPSNMARTDPPNTKSRSACVWVCDEALENRWKNLAVPNTNPNFEPNMQYILLQQP